MDQSRRPGRHTLLPLLAPLACAGTWAAAQVRGIRETSGGIKLTEAMKTLCVGRFLIAVPSQPEVGFSNEMRDGLEISTVEESEAVFRERLAARKVVIAGHSPT